MRIFIRLLGSNIADSLKFDVENSTTIADIKKLVHQETNLTPTDKVNCFFNNVELTSNEISLWDLSVKHDQTITMVIERESNTEKFRVLKPKEMGVFSVFTNEKGEHIDQPLANIFSFLSAKDIALSVELTCRRFRIATIFYHDIVWEPMLSRLYLQHAASSHSNKLTASLASTSTIQDDDDEEKQKTSGLFKGRGIDCRKLFKQTIVIEKVWEHIKMLTPNQIDRKKEGQLEYENQLLSQITKLRQVKVRRKPKELTQDDEQFLQQHDLKKLKLDVRSRGKKSKEEREADLEKYARFKRLAKRKEEGEHGTWQVVPEDLLVLSYDELMKHTFSFKSDNVTGYYNNRGQYIIVQADKLLFVGELEIVGEKFKIAHILCDENQHPTTKETDKDIAQAFFKYMSKCTTKHIEEKKLINIQVQEGGVKKLFADAILDVLITLRKYEPGVTAERPRLEIKEAEKSLEKKLQQMQSTTPRGHLRSVPSHVELSEDELNDPEFGRATLNATSIAFKEDEGISASLDNIVETYVAALIQALKSDSIAQLGLPLIEQAFFKKIKKEDAEATSKLGVCFARALTKYLSETEKARQTSSSSTDEEEISLEESLKSTNKKKKKAFRKAILAVESEEDKQLVISNIASFYESN